MTDALQPSDPRQKRLRNDRKRMDTVSRESDHVKPVPVATPGGEPEKYIVTFHCRGIVGIDANREPIYGERHEVEIYCDIGYPGDVPKLRWITPIWHPNIQSSEPKAVCVNKFEWLAGLGLDHLCWQMFDMVQYKNYHAEFTFPYPLDAEAAKWVRDYAEPRNIVNKKRGISVDDRPFFRPQSKVSLGPQVEAPIARKRVKFVKDRTDDSEQAPAAQVTSSGRVRFAHLR